MCIILTGDTNRTFTHKYNWACMYIVSILRSVQYGLGIDCMRRAHKHTQTHIKHAEIPFRNAFWHSYNMTCKANINLDSHVDKNTREWKMSSKSNSCKRKKRKLSGEKEIKLRWFSFHSKLALRQAPASKNLYIEHSPASSSECKTKPSRIRREMEEKETGNTQNSIECCNVRKWSNSYRVFLCIQCSAQTNVWTTKKLQPNQFWTVTSSNGTK